MSKKVTIEDVKKKSYALEKRVKEVKKIKGGDKFAEIEKRLNDLQKDNDELRKNKPRKSEFDIEAIENPSLDRMLKADTDKPEIIEFQKACDAVLFMSLIHKKHPTELPIYKQLNVVSSELLKAMNAATAAQGGNWVPTDFSARFDRQVELESKVAGLFEDIPMPTDNYELPIDESGLTMYTHAEAVGDNANQVPAGTPTVGKNTLNAKKLAIRALVSTEIGEDSVINISSYITDRIARAYAAGWDNVLVNGDTAGTHMDTDVTAANDIQKAFLGMRALAVDGTYGAAIAGAALAETDIHIGRREMGKYGVDTSKMAIVTGPVGYLEMVTRFDNFRTLDKYGALATVFNGELGKFFGIPVIVSDQYKENLNDTGVYDGSTTDQTSLTLVYRPALVTGTRRGVTIKAVEDITTDQMITVMTVRKALINLYAIGSNEFVYHVYKALG